MGQTACPGRSLPFFVLILAETVDVSRQCLIVMLRYPHHAMCCGKPRSPGAAAGPLVLAVLIGGIFLPAIETRAVELEGLSTIPNRTVPKMGSPKAGLEFPANPEPRDFFRAHVFAEPLVPVGDDPSPGGGAADRPRPRILTHRSLLPGD